MAIPWDGGNRMLSNNRQQHRASSERKLNDLEIHDDLLLKPPKRPIVCRATGLGTARFGAIAGFGSSGQPPGQVWPTDVTHWWLGR